VQHCWPGADRSLPPPPQAAERHAEFTKEDGHHYVCDLGTPSGTWLNDKRVDAGSKRMLRPGDILEFGQPGSGLRYKIKVGTVSQTPAVPSSCW
jgi:pSer/pThr/pTyr-binding forkhead associated (FHA) protein